MGLTEEAAEARKLDVAIGGVHIVAPGAVDLINTATVAMLSEATVHELMRFTPRHPSIGEVLVDAAMDVEKRSLHMLKW